MRRNPIDVLYRPKDGASPDAADTLMGMYRTELPESIRVTPDLPPQPNYNDFFTDEALEKYGWDNARAQAAFQQATNDWLLKAQDVRSNAVAEQGRKVQEYTQQSAQYVDAARKHYDAAEKLNIPDYQEKEDAFMQVVPAPVPERWERRVI
ncbi:hypothetical protein JJ20_003061 [Salmonella enterica subsp. enterica serovar Brunei]|nr:hypothetical protein [Salmonella enterica subsp. enterica serovar Brunei]